LDIGALLATCGAEGMTLYDATTLNADLHAVADMRR
jgi:hypothetical protein